MQVSDAYVSDPQQKPWTPRLGGASLAGDTLYVVSHIVSGEIRSVKLHWERTIGNFSWTVPYVPFSTADFHLILLL